MPTVCSPSSALLIRAEMRLLLPWLLQWEGDGDAAGEAGSSKTIDFVYDPDSDTPGEGRMWFALPLCLLLLHLLLLLLGVVGERQSPVAAWAHTAAALRAPHDPVLSARARLTPPVLPRTPGPCSDEIAAEISSEFHLSDTDRDICAAALKEWLDRGMDAQQG